MLKPGGEPDLAQEPVSAHGGGDVGPEDLQGHGALVPQVQGEPDLGHASAAELALDAITALENRLQRVHLDHRGLRELVPYYFPVPRRSTPGWNRSGTSGVLLGLH